ncbi:hypothetical protein AALA00_12850 [Lachnospiraceae bacterium 46-15]
MSDKKKVTVLASGDCPVLEIGSERISISSYKIQGSAGGTTELCVTIVGTVSEIGLDSCFKCLNMQEKEMTIRLHGSCRVLQTDFETIQLSGYKIQSSANGITELCLTITSSANEIELKASPE